MKIKLTLAASIALAAAGPACAVDLVIATVNNGHMIEMQKLTPVLREGVSRHQAEVGHARRRRAAPARHDRHRHQGRPVRRDDDRHVRDADLGQEGLADGDQARRRLRRRRPAAGDAQRPVGRRQALRRAVLRRELDADVPQGPRRQGRRHVPRARPGTRCATPPRRCTIRRPASTASACAASRAGATTWPSSRPWSTPTAASGST